MLLLIDNYDSFTYNLYQYLSELGAEVLVCRNDEVTPEQAEVLAPSHLVISPGPCTPHEAGASNAIIERLGPRIPTLGVCLGHQCIGQVFGGRVVRAPEPVHGKTAAIHHQGAGVLGRLPSPFTATRYHSLIVERSSLPDALEVTAETEDGLIMGLRHRRYPIEGVQFHPESVLTSAGKDLLRNFLRVTRTGTKETKRTKVHEGNDENDENDENQRGGNGGNGGSQRFTEDDERGISQRLSQRPTKQGINRAIHGAKPTTAIHGAKPTTAIHGAKPTTADRSPMRSKRALDLSLPSATSTVSSRSESSAVKEALP